jgi:ketosteroid isomerase-like protein
MTGCVAIIATIYEEFGRGNIPAIVELLAADVKWERWADDTAQTAGVPWLLERDGKAGAEEFFRITGKFEIHEFRVVSLLGGGNQVAAEVVIDATVPTGRRYRDEELHVWTLNDDGKVMGLRHYVDTAKHIAAARPLIANVEKQIEPNDTQGG